MVARFAPGFGETVTVVRASTAVDDWGDPIPGTIVETLLERCAVAPRESGDDDSPDGQRLIIGWTLYAPPTADIIPTDEVIVRGDLHHVDGDIADWRNPYAGADEVGKVVQLRRS